MNENGIIRCIDKVHRIVLPQELLHKIGAKDGQYFKIAVNEEKKQLILDMENIEYCVFCSSTDLLVPYEKKYICSECKEKISNLR